MARENNTYWLIQEIIAKEIQEAFKLREPSPMPTKKEIKKIIRNTVLGNRKAHNERH